MKILKQRRLMMMNSIYKILSADFSLSQFIRYGENKNISLYIGKDECLRYSFDFRGKFTPAKINSSDVISVQQIKVNDEYFLRFSLEEDELLEYFCTFCEDLINSTTLIHDDNTAYKTLRSRYFSWKMLFKSNRGNLSEFEIMGLIGELLFLNDTLIPEKGIDLALESWTGPEKTHKDFSYDYDWYEIKTVNVGKESVHISSIEQLESDFTGHLVVYCIEKMSPSFSGIKLNALVSSIIKKLITTSQREMFMAKLDLYGFDFSPMYDNYVYVINSMSIYNVEGDSFPRVRYLMLPESIIKVQYDIILSKIEQYKTSQTT